MKQTTKYRIHNGMITALLAIYVLIFAPLYMFAKGLECINNKVCNWQWNMSYKLLKKYNVNYYYDIKAKKAILKEIED